MGPTDILSVVNALSTTPTAIVGSLRRRVPVFALACVGVGGLTEANFEELRLGKVPFGGTPKPARKMPVLRLAACAPEIMSELDNE